MSSLSCHRYRVADMRADVRLIECSFDPAAELAAFSARRPEAGGTASYLGQVRSGNGVEALDLKHYAPLTLPGMTALADSVLSRFDLMGVMILHRTGVMLPGEPIVLVSAASKHRRDAIQAVDYAMDHLKSDSWFWKREKVGGVWRWIEPREQDYADKARWV